MSPALFAVRRLDDGVVSLRIATDAEPHIGTTWTDRFTDTVANLGEDRAVRAVLLEGGRYFSAGASRELLLESVDTAAPYLSRVPRALLELPVPVVAAAAGHAIGGGLLIALWCDAALFAEESLYGANFMALGLTPGMGATHIVPEAFGGPLGRDLLFTGRLLTGREIRESICPLSHAVRPRPRVHADARALARAMGDGPRDAVTLLKRELANRRREALDRALLAEQHMRDRLLADPAARPEIARRYIVGAPTGGGDTP